MTDSPWLDPLETRSAEAREGALMARLPGLVAHAAAHAPGWARRLAGVDPRAVCTRKALSALPVLRKDELAGLQAADPPFGGLVTQAPGALGAIYLSPGPILDVEGRQDDPWRGARALHAAGIRSGHVVQNCFSYHMTPGAWMVHHAARRLGCAVIPAGTGQVAQQVELLRRVRPDAWLGTPSFLRIVLEQARESGLDPASCIRRALVAAEALPPSLRDWFLEQGVGSVLQWYGTADVGLIAYESLGGEGMILDEDLILEIVRPGTGDPVVDGEIGEVVVTSFNPAYPLLRFGTGDLSAVLRGPSPCGRTNVRIRGWLGRADQTAKVRGLFVRPGQVAELARRFPETGRVRLVVTGALGSDTMTLHCELGGAPAEGLEERLVEAIREVTGLRGEVTWVPPGSLPDDGLVIEDARRYD